MKQIQQMIHSNGYAGRVTITRVPHGYVEISLQFRNELPWNTIYNAPPFREYLMYHLPMTEMLADIADNVDRLFALGCENAEGVFRAGIRYSAQEWHNKMELEYLRWSRDEDVSRGT